METKQGNYLIVYSLRVHVTWKSLVGSLLLVVLRLLSLEAFTSLDFGSLT